ncbi:unnamed protein product [Litomosoides sigmodontis]|uniref:BHLH domain-containing protein n=1 Tax=Litomosoides sigmodontis TaxID=42156 RepID=A0A3P6T615_LITSI|nr:unnamed protein product [Litomosoides sigmodontis]
MIPRSQHVNSDPIQQGQNQPVNDILNSANHPANPSGPSGDFVDVTNLAQPPNAQSFIRFPPQAPYTPSISHSFQCVPQFLASPILIRSMMLETVHIRTPLILSIEHGQLPLTINNAGHVTLQQPVQSHGNKQILPKVTTASSNERSTVPPLGAKLSKHEDNDYNLEDGLKRLSNLVNLRGGAKTKPEESVVLTYTGKRIRQLNTEIVLCRRKIKRLSRNVKRLSDKVASLRASLPLSLPGKASMLCQKVEVEEFLERYIREKTDEDHSFWIMAKIMKPLLETLMEKLDQLPKDKLLSGVNAWVKENFNPNIVRSCASSFLTEFDTHCRALSKSTALQEYVQMEISEQKKKVNEEGEKVVDLMEG